MNKVSISRFHAEKNSILSAIWWNHENRLKVLKSLVVAGVLVSSAFISQFFPVKFLAPLLVLLMAGLGLIVFLKVPFYGILIVVSASLLIDFEIGTGTSTSLNIVIILLPLLMGVWFVDRFVRQSEIRFIPSRTNPPLILLVLASLLAFGIGQLTWFYYARHAPLFSQLGGLAIFILSAGAYIFTANVIGNIKQLEVLTWVFIVVGMLIVILRVIPVIGGLIGRILPGGATGSIFWIWLLAIMYSQLIINNDLRLPARLVLIASIAVTMYVAVYMGYGWKSGWIPPLVAMGVITWLRFRRLRYLLTIGAIVVIWLIASDLIQSDQYSYITRLEAWKILLTEIINVNPVFGLGPANYRFYTPLFPIMGYWVEFNSHNNYIDIIAQIGVLGLIAFLWFAWEVWRTGWDLTKRGLGGFSNAYVVGAMGGLVGVLVAGMLGDWVIPFVYNVGLNGFRASVLGWIFLGGLIALQHILSTNQESKETLSN